MIFFPLGILFAILGPIFEKTKLKVSATFTGLKSKALLCLEKIASQVFNRSVLIFRINPGNNFFSLLSKDQSMNCQ